MKRLRSALNQSYIKVYPTTPLKPEHAKGSHTMSWKYPTNPLHPKAVTAQIGKGNELGYTLHNRCLAVASLCSLLVVGCVNHKTDDAWKQDRERLQAQIESMNKSQTMLSKQFWTMNNQLSELESRLTLHETEQQARENQFQAHLTELDQGIEALSKGKKVKPRPTHARNAPLPKKGSPGKGKPMDAPALTKQAPVISEKEIKDMYINAYLALKNGRYEQANTDFHKFLSRFPNSVYAPRAAYWLGETLHAQGLTTEALEAFRNAASAPDGNPKHNAALLRLGQLNMELGRTDDARTALLQLLKEHPQSPEAEKVRKMLSKAGAGAGM